MSKLLIGYLTSGSNWREKYFKYFHNSLNIINNIKKIKLLILHHEDISHIKNILNNNLINYEYEIICFNINNNYTEKIKYLISHAEENLYDYCMKIDNDILINDSLLDFLIDNINILDDEKNICLSPNISNGIPTVDKFISNFLDKNDIIKINDIFHKHKFESIWGNNYDSLNDATIRCEFWDSENFYNNVRKLPFFYKGIHPIRLDSNANIFLNDKILEKKDLFTKKLNYKLYVNNSPYFCNSIFIIKTKIYKEYFYDKSLWVDAYDEVPLNKYIDKVNGNKIFVENSFCIHILYNTISDYDKKEDIFISKFFS